MEIKKKQAEGGNNQSTSTNRRNSFVRYGAVAAAAVLVVGGILGVVLASGGFNAGAAQQGDSVSASTASVAEASATEAAAPQVAPKTLDAAPDEVRAMDSYDELYDLFESMRARDAVAYGATTADGGMLFSEATANDAAAESPSAGVSASPKDAAEAKAACLKGDYSETNTQVKGVDEADVVKTDGKYIYYLVDNQLNIIEPAGSATKLVSSTMLSNSDKWWAYSAELFLNGDRLMIINQGYATVWTKSTDGGYNDSREQTQVLLYDVSDPAKPRALATLGQSGSYLSSRMIGDYVYIVTSHYVFSPVRDRIATYVPEVVNGEASKPVEARDIFVYGTPKNAAYTVIGAIDLANGTDYASVKAVFGGTSDVYCNEERMLLSTGVYDQTVSDIAPDETGKNVQITTNRSQTRLMLFTLDGASIALSAHATVPGTLLNQFAVDEYKGVFRLVTTRNDSEERLYTDGVDSYEYDSKTTNAVYTLDASLQQLGQIEDLAVDEWIESVRFDGDIGYFVTFRQVDPLFAVDLSNPKNPKILSQLKIPGFSEYLHVYGDGLLLGLGYEADSETGATKGVKLSMFDVRNATNVTEITTARVDADWTVVGSNHKAILVSVEKNLIAFPADDSYYIYRYTKAGFEQLARVRMDGDLTSWNLRGVYVGDYFYVLGDGGVTVISMQSFEKVAFCSISYG